MENSRCSVKVGQNITETFDDDQGLRQDDGLSCNFFDIVLKAIVLNSEEKTSGPTFQQYFQLLVYPDGINIIGRTKRFAFAREMDSTKMRLTVNGPKTKCMLSSKKKKRDTTPPNRSDHRKKLI